MYHEYEMTIIKYAENIGGQWRLHKMQWYKMYIQWFYKVAYWLSFVLRMSRWVMIFYGPFIPVLYKHSTRSLFSLRTHTNEYAQHHNNSICLKHGCLTILYGPFLAQRWTKRMTQENMIITAGIFPSSTSTGLLLIIIEYGEKMQIF